LQTESKHSAGFILKDEKLLFLFDFRYNRGEVTRLRNNSHNEEHCNVYFSDKGVRW
jgi:hypothetical protein